VLKGASGAGIPGRLNADPATVDHGLAKLVLSLIELVRRLLEKQVLRRIDAGSLTDDEIERMGETILRLDRKMEELKPTRGLQDGDLDLNLGPPRRLTSRFVARTLVLQEHRGWWSGDPGRRSAEDRETSSGRRGVSMMRKSS
jgi:Gas vesicle protein K